MSIRGEARGPEEKTRGSKGPPGREEVMRPAQHGDGEHGILGREEPHEDMRRENWRGLRLERSLTAGRAN